MRESEKINRERKNFSFADKISMLTFIILYAIRDLKIYYNIYLLINPNILQKRNNNLI